MKDNEIVDLYTKRDETAIHESDKKYGKFCYRIAYTILMNNEDSEECVNDTWIRTWNAIPPERPNSLKLFLAKITRNLSIDRYREIHSEKRGGDQEIFSFEEMGCVILPDTIDEDAASNQLIADLNHFLRSIPPRDAYVFIRRYFYLDPAREIAKRYNMQESNVFTVLSRTRQKLREFLTDKGYSI